MTEDGWREAMVGTLDFFDKSGERQHTVYLAATPEYGKAGIPIERAVDPRFFTGSPGGPKGRRPTTPISMLVLQPQKNSVCFGIVGG